MLRQRNISPIQRAIKPGALLDIEEDFDSISFDIIIGQKSDIGLNTIFQVCQLHAGWQIFAATLAGKALESSVANGYRKCSILSPLLWSLVLEDQFIKLNENSCYSVGYTDDTATLIYRKFCNITELLQVALSMVQGWCDRTKLSINSQKTVVTQFARKRCLSGQGYQSPLDIHWSWLLWTYSGQRNDMEGTAENVMNMAYKAYCTCMGIFGKVRGLKPSMGMAFSPW